MSAKSKSAESAADRRLQLERELREADDAILEARGQLTFLVNARADVERELLTVDDVPAV